MKVLHYLERIEMIHKLVDQERTGTPAEFARRLGISRTRLYEIMDDLKLEGAPIAYSRSCRTFYYEEPFHISITFELKPLSFEDTRSVNGGGEIRDGVQYQQIFKATRVSSGREIFQVSGQSQHGCEDPRIISGGQFFRCSPFLPDDGRVTLYSKLTNC